MRTSVDTEIAKAKATMPEAERDALVSDLLATRSEPLRARLLSLTVKSAVGMPPATRSLPTGGSVDADPLAIGDSGEPSETAIRSELAHVEKDHPAEPKHVQWARARRAAIAKRKG
jgi:hypothetical protein